MSHPDLHYPEPVYQGDGGLTNATLQRAGDEPDLRYESGGTVHYLATHESTGGQFGLYLWSMAAVQSGPEPHLHRSISESFYVLPGTVRLYDGKTWIDGRRVTSCSCPRAASTRSGTSPASAPRC